MTTIAYHLREYHRQLDMEPIESWVWESLGIDHLATILDVGCGAGQTLRHLLESHEVDCTGVDVDWDALNFGHRSSVPIRFVRASAYSLPFPDESFSHVLCRNALTYMHQRRALAEIARVLKPNGRLYLYIEGFGYDLRLLRTSRDWKNALCRTRDFFYGLTLSLTGWQPTPGSRLTGGRAFGSARQLSRCLRALGCETVRIVAPRSKIELVARRRS